MRTYSIGDAARILGVSPDTVRRWTDSGRLPSRRDEAGRRLISGPDLAAYAVELAADTDADANPVRTSARNAFTGIVTAIKRGDVVAQVELQSGPHRLVSVLTTESIDELGLEVGSHATARVKSTNVFMDVS